MIKNYRTQAIVTLILSILFCWFGLATGIPALIYSTRVTESIGRGDYPRAVDASRKARLLSWISVGIIAFFWVIILIILVVTLSHNSPAGTPVPPPGTPGRLTPSPGPGALAAEAGELGSGGIRKARRRRRGRPQ